LLLLIVELGGGDESAIQCPLASLPRELGILDVGNTVVVVHIVALSYVHYSLYRDTLAEVVLITQIAAVELEATVIIVGTESRVEIAEHLDDGFTLGFVTLLLCLNGGEAHAGQSACYNHFHCFHHVFCFKLTLQRYTDGVTDVLRRD